MKEQESIFKLNRASQEKEADMEEHEGILAKWARTLKHGTGGGNLLRNRWVIAAGLLTCFALVSSAAPLFGQVTIITLALQPAAGGTWVNKIPNSTGGVCTPCPNPWETTFMDVTTPNGPGVAFSSKSTQGLCCTCDAEIKEFPLFDMTGTRLTLNTTLDAPHLKGFFSATRSAADPFSVASFRIDLKNQGIVVATRVFAAENHPNNNCAPARGAETTLLTSGANFDVDLSLLFANVDFDQVDISLMGAGCLVTAGATVTVGGLTLEF